MSLGPGKREYLAPRALEALTTADVVVGYKMYLGLVADLLEGKQVFSSGMRKEIERCQTAIEMALAGHRVALVSSGDAGIYGMAGLVLDLCHARKLRLFNELHEKGKPSDFTLEVIPGVPAFNAAASLLGAPLMHDFAAISLSDHLTPWDLIERRLAAAASADFVIAIYNPRSRARPDSLQKALDIILQHRPADTAAAVVRSALREGQWACLVTLGTLPVHEVDMQSVILVGNSNSYAWNGWMITPRGYLQKYRWVGEQGGGEDPAVEVHPAGQVLPA